jgi:hypothetical protein
MIRFTAICASALVAACVSDGADVGRGQTFVQLTNTAPNRYCDADLCAELQLQIDDSNVARGFFLHTRHFRRAIEFARALPAVCEVASLDSVHYGQVDIAREPRVRLVPYYNVQFRMVRTEGCPYDNVLFSMDRDDVDILLRDGRVSYSRDYEEP